MAMSCQRRSCGRSGGRCWTASCFLRVTLLFVGWNVCKSFLDQHSPFALLYHRCLLTFCSFGFGLPSRLHLPILRVAASPGTAETRTKAIARDGGGSDGGASQTDWREFRARLVKQEQFHNQGQDETREAWSKHAVDAPLLEGWAHEMPAIEPGALVLATGSDHFALTQQYLHKAIILIVQHDESGDVGLIINRPTAFHADDFDLTPTQTTHSDDRRWNVWFGGDSHGIVDGSGDKHVFCIHTSVSFAEYSAQVIKGVFLIDFAVAQQLVAEGKAAAGDFMVLIGYCAWMPGHLQAEVDRGDTWTLAAADQRMFLGELQEMQNCLQTRLHDFEARSVSDVGNGIEQWRRLYTAVRSQRLEQQTQVAGDDKHVDQVLDLWLERCLLPSSQLAEGQGGETVEVWSKGVVQALKAGTIIRGSATAWVLGKPVEDPIFSHFPPTSWRPHQYLHKAVLMLLQDVTEGERSVLVLLNGPTLRKNPTDIQLGGTRDLGSGKLIELGTDEHTLRIEGHVSFRPGVIEKLLAVDALQVVEDVGLDAIASNPKRARWEAAGGRTDNPREAQLAAVGDRQWLTWYRRFFGRDVAIEDRITDSNL